MEHDVEELMRAEEEHLKQLDGPDLSPEHREIIGVKDRLESMEAAHSSLADWRHQRVAHRLVA